MKIFLRIIACLAGAVLGAILGALVIVAVVKKRIEKTVEEENENNFSPEESKRLDKIKHDAKRAYKRTYKARTLRKIFGLSKKRRETQEQFSYADLIEKTAEVYNPDSSRPMLELTGNEVFGFGHTVVKRLEDIFDASGLSFLRSFTAGTAIDYITFLDGVIKKRSVKKTVGTYKIVWRVINAVNPFFWLKTIIRTVAAQRILDEVVYASINIVVTEFASLYKKSSTRLQAAA